METPDTRHALVSLEGDYTTIEGTLVAFTALEEALRAAKDKRGVFIGAYIVITSAMKEAIAASDFEDTAWVRQYLLSFAQLYLEAFRAYDAGDIEHVPTAWRIAFELSGSGRGMILQHLLLGVNAHINHDLPIALTRSGVDPDRVMRYNDHTGVNRVLQKATGNLQDHVERFYSPALYILDALSGHWDEKFAGMIVDKARDTAWQHCIDLADCTDEESRNAVLKRIDDHAGAFAELIARPYVSPHELYEVYRTAF